MRNMLILALGLTAAGLVSETIGYIGIIVLTLTIGWVLIDLAGKV